jgi:hypothetical protein
MLRMSGTPYPDPRNGTHQRDPLDDKLDQIRELLYGEFKRDSDARVALIEARVRELEASLSRKLDSIQDRLDELSINLASERKQAFEQLSSSVLELGENIRRIVRD